MTESQKLSRSRSKKGGRPSAKTEPERLRAQARRALELARAINDPEAALRLKAHAGELLERADALDERKDEN